MSEVPRLLGPAAVRDLAAQLQLRPTKQRGQNFVVDPNTIRRIVATADVSERDVVLEVGPGLGSLTLGLLGVADRVIAVEIDDTLAAALPGTVERYAPDRADRFEVVTADAMRIRDLPGPPPTTLVANLPYNVAVPVLLHLLQSFDSIEHGLVMVQLEVAERLAAGPGSRVYGVPSVKLAWYARVERAGVVGSRVFWPQPRIDSGLVAFHRRPQPTTAVPVEQVFALIDAAFAQRRKTLRAALSDFAGSAAVAEEVLRSAGVDPGARGEQLDCAAFVAVAEALAVRRRDHGSLAP